jgi:G3E family GTPase
MTDDRIPVTLLTGFLGAGKTTLLRRVLAELGGKGILVVENEFGAANIDSEMLEEIEPGMVRRVNGCICCAVEVDLQHTFQSIAEARAEKGVEFDRVILETTGMAEPASLTTTFFAGDAIERAFRLDAVVTVVDLRHIEMDMVNSPVAQAQIALADVLVLNKVDLVSAEDAERVGAEVRAANPLATHYTTVRSDVPASAVLDLAAFTAERAPEGHHHHTHDWFGSALAEDPGPHDLARLRGWLAETVGVRPDDYYRYKGVVHADGGLRAAVQGVHDLFDTEALRAWRDDEVPMTRLVFIGLDLEPEALQAGLEACRAGPSP